MSYQILEGMSGLFAVIHLENNTFLHPNLTWQDAAYWYSSKEWAKYTLSNAKNIDGNVFCMTETLKHKNRVGDLLLQAVSDLQSRALHHDDSKFSLDEFTGFAAITKDMAGNPYGSEKYKQKLNEARPTIELHQKRNRHHPEYFRDGIKDMTLIDLIEMLADWKAAGERPGGMNNLRSSIAFGKTRWGFDDQFEQMLINTAQYMGWINT